MCVYSFEYSIGLIALEFWLKHILFNMQIKRSDPNDPTSLFSEFLLTSSGQDAEVTF